MELNEATRKQACASTSRSLASDPDRLSALPDCLLHTIMSFMKARQAVQTCVLSTRWRHLWHSVPCLDIDLDEFKVDNDTGSFEDNDIDNDTEWGNFGNFTVNLLLRCNIALLDSFKLRAGWVGAPYSAKRQAGGWIRHAMKYWAPDTVIQREGLCSSFWHLKSLYLCYVFLNKNFGMYVSSVCHTLEDLELDNCTCAFHSITSHTLKNLVLKNCGWFKLSEITLPTLKTLVIDGGSNCYLLVIVAPAVTYLLLDVNVDCFLGRISIKEMPYLANASIHQRGCGHMVENQLPGNQFNLLCDVSDTTSLELSGFGIMKLSEESKPFQEFKNLRNLLLDNCDLTDDFQMLTLFLQNSLNLEKLTLRHCKFPNDSKKKKGVQKPKKSSPSQCQTLDIQCDNLKLTEIIYKDNDVHQPVELLMCISWKMPKNYIKLTKVD
ncbi:unnamed protein product [Urochloa decumbens]|uniref:F-box domain-containing protein n=1 Tax=Urochloa decumbens TaxID=240449 RepID=A0ABC9B4X4_9POAL